MLTTKPTKVSKFWTLKKPGKKSNSLLELSSQLKTQKMLLLFALDHMDKEPLLNTPNTPTLNQLHQPDGHQVPSPIKTPRNSKNQDYWLLLTQSLTDKPLLKPHTLTFQPLPFATLTVHYNMLTLLSHATTDQHNPSPWSSGSWLEKSKSWEEN